MDKINATRQQEIYAALKLIEKLFKDGLISDYIFRNILDDYADVVDVTCFSLGKTNYL